MKGIIKYTVFLFGFILLLAGCGQSTPEQKPDSAAEKPVDELLLLLDEVNSQIRSDSLNPDHYAERARIYADREAWNEAFKDITTAIEMDSTHAPYYVVLSDVYLGMGKLQKTVESLETAIRIDAGNTGAYLRLAEMSIVIRDYKKALDYIDKALRVDELTPKAYMLRGVILMETGDTIRGIRNFQRAIDVKQDYLEAHVQLGTIYAFKKNDLAIDYFNNALNIDPENTDVQYYLGMYYQETGRYEKAIQSYESILERQPDFYIALYNIGYINLVYLNDYEAAIDYFTQTIELNATYTEAYYNRGFAYELLKDVERSQADYKKVLELHPNYEKAIDGLNRIADYLESNQ